MPDSHRQRVLEVLFPRQPAARLGFDDTAVDAACDAIEPQAALCTICLEPIGSAQNVSGVCDHMVRD